MGVYERGGIVKVEIKPNNLQELREKSGMGRAEASRAMGLSFSLMIKHEKQQRAISKEHIEKYAELYGVEPHQIFL